MTLNVIQKCSFFKNTFWSFFYQFQEGSVQMKRLQIISMHYYNQDPSYHMCSRGAVNAWRGPDYNTKYLRLPKSTARVAVMMIYEQFSTHVFTLKFTFISGCDQP